MVAGLAQTGTHDLITLRPWSFLHPHVTHLTSSCHKNQYFPAGLTLPQLCRLFLLSPPRLFWQDHCPYSDQTISRNAYRDRWRWPRLRWSDRNNFLSRSRCRREHFFPHFHPVRKRIRKKSLVSVLTGRTEEQGGLYLNLPKRHLNSTVQTKHTVLTSKNFKKIKKSLKTMVLWTSRSVQGIKGSYYFGLQVFVPNPNILFAPVCFYLSI